MGLVSAVSQTMDAGDRANSIIAALRARRAAADKTFDVAMARLPELGISQSHMQADDGHDATAISPHIMQKALTAAQPVTELMASAATPEAAVKQPQRFPAAQADTIALSTSVPANKEEIVKAVG